jgi:hypothetical protein
MKHLQLIVLLTIVAASTAPAQSESKVAPSQRSVERQLIELERQLSDALVKEDAAVLDRLWSNDLVFTFPNGKVSSQRDSYELEKECDLAGGLRTRSCPLSNPQSSPRFRHLEFQSKPKSSKGEYYGHVRIVNSGRCARSVSEI